MKRLLSAVFLSTLLLTACLPSPPVPPPSSPESLRINAASEVRLLEDAGVFRDFQAWYQTRTREEGKEKHVTLDIEYLGSVEIKLKVQAYTGQNPGDVDVFWAASPIWLPGSLVRDKTSVMRTYIVFAVDPGLATQLGWSRETGIATSDIIAAINAGKINLAMPSASQDDAGANFFLALYSATNGNTENLRTIMSAVSRTASNAADLKEAFVQDRLSGSGKYNAIVLPESMLIATNLELASKGASPLTVFYVKDAVGVQNYQLGWTTGIDEEKQARFKKLVEYLTSDTVKAKLQSLGFRTGRVGMRVENPDPAIFNPAWGIDTQTEFTLADLPKDAIINQALDAYQTSLRNPSYTVYCLDYSGSMDGQRIADLKTAMGLLLDPEMSARYLLQASSGDTTYVIPFAGQNLAEYAVDGNDPANLLGLNDTINRQGIASSTNIYGCAMRAIEVVETNIKPGQLPAVILLTDGEHNANDTSFTTLSDVYPSRHSAVPIFTILFGAANEREMQQIADYTGGTVCDGRGGQENLVRCFRLFKGNN